LLSYNSTARIYETTRYVLTCLESYWKADMTSQSMTSSTTELPHRTTSSLDVGLLVLRVAAGLVLIVHGTEKLFGWFGGSGIGGATKLFTSFGYSPAKPFAILASMTEIGGGILFIVGFLTPLATAAIIGNFLNAAVSVIPGGFLKSNGDFAIILGVTAITLACTGPGEFALDRGRQWFPARLNPAAFSIGLGLAAGALILVIRSVL
jgi:putative oxidoreductase